MNAGLGLILNTYAAYAVAAVLIVLVVLKEVL